MKLVHKLLSVTAIAALTGFATAACVSFRGGGSETGLYVGIIGFNDNVARREIGLLDAGNKTQFQGFIDRLSMEPATGLYYAVDNAVTMLKAATLPKDVVNVSVVTFTDGLDNTSISLNKKYKSRDAYRDAVNARLASTKIKNLNISAYSIGIKGGDVRDEDAFRASLSALASNPGNAKEVTSMAEVESTFVEIANSLYSESQTQSIRLRINDGYDDATKIRFTFDSVTDAANSNRYIEGTYRRSGGARSLQNVAYQGLTSRSGTTVKGGRTGVYVYFTFENTTAAGGIVDMANVQQWEYIGSQGSWQRNSEFGRTEDKETIVHRKSAVIMLVLDCTTSLNADGANGFSEMQSAARNFIDVLARDSGGQSAALIEREGDFIRVGDFTGEIVDGRSVTITGYTGNATALAIPAQIQRLPVTVIGGWAFSDSLSSITIPSSVTYISNSAFYGCSGLSSITVDSRNPVYASVDGVLFDKNIRTLITYPAGKTASNYTIPSSVTSIGDWAFSDCGSLSSITMPSSVTSIGYAAFSGCSRLSSITVDSRNPAYASVDGVLFDKNIRTLIAYPAGKTASTYTIPSSVTSIGDAAFSGCSHLASITIPSSVTSIGYAAFFGCSSLASITIPSSVTSIGDWAFSGCSSLASITIPFSVTSIGDEAFSDCGSLASITIPSSVTSIGYAAFSGCSSLASITIPSSVTSIGYAAFSGCSSLASITIPFSVTSIGDEAFSDCGSLASITIPSSVTSIGYTAFFGCSSLASITIPSSVTSIGDWAFEGCSSLSSITLSRRTEVGEGAFPETARISYRD